MRELTNNIAQGRINSATKQNRKYSPITAAEANPFLNMKYADPLGMFIPSAPIKIPELEPISNLTQSILPKINENMISSALETQTPPPAVVPATPAPIKPSGKVRRRPVQPTPKPAVVSTTNGRRTSINNPDPNRAIVTAADMGGPIQATAIPPDPNAQAMAMAQYAAEQSRLLAERDAYWASQNSESAPNMYFRW